MDLFDEGGLIDEGNTSDPVSGNETPVGSLNEEVRDDIPAQLSEGEFVLPADVVRFHGLEKIMQLRDEAKQGLQRMEDMGQMGNSDEAVLSDDVPFDIDDLELDDDPVEMQVGGFMPGQTVQSNVASQFGNMQRPITQQPVTQPMPVPQQPSLMPQQSAVPTVDPGSVPKFQDFIKATPGTAPENREYINPETGEKRFFVFIGGKSTVDIPEGFIPISQYKPKEKTKPQPVIQQQQQQREEDPSRITDAEKKDQFERETRIKERKAAAYELGYTKEADPLKEAGKFLLGAIIPGGGFLAGMDKPEKGTIMPDGTIADGDGNTFDPRTGEQVGGKGFLGFGKSAAEKSLSGPAFDALSEEEKAAARAGQLAVPESSLAGLRSLAGEDSIKDLLASLPEEVKVASTTMAGAGKTAGQTAEEFRADEKRRANLAGMPAADQLAGGDVIDERIIQTANALMARDSTLDANDAMRMAVIGETQGIDAVREYQTSIKKDGVVDAAFAGSTLGKAKKAVPSGIAASIASSQRAAPVTKTTRDTRLSPGALGGRIERRSPGALGGRASERDIQLQAVATRKNKVTSTLNAAKSKDPKQFRKDVKAGKYNAEYAKIDKERENENLIRNSRPNKAGVNLAEKVGEKLARKIEDRQGTATNVDTNTGQISYGKDHDWSKPTQTNVNRSTSSKGQEIASSRDDAGPGGKIVCTAMNDAYGFGSFRQAIWLQHSKDMDPAYQRGYHRIFKPLVRLAYRDKKWYNKSTRYILEGIARRRTADIWLQKKGKRHFVGAIERTILEPLCYIVGKIR